MRRWSSLPASADRGGATPLIFGAAETIESILTKRGWKINTSFVERLNLDFRQHVAAIGRRVNTLCKHEAGLRQQLALFHAYHNFVLPHASLRVPLSELDPIPETGATLTPEQFVELYVNQALSLNEIAHRLGVSRKRSPGSRKRKASDCGHQVRRRASAASTPPGFMSST